MLIREADLKCGVVDFGYGFFFLILRCCVGYVYRELGIVLEFRVFFLYLVVRLFGGV